MRPRQESNLWPSAPELETRNGVLTRETQVADERNGQSCPPTVAAIVSHDAGGKGGRDDRARRSSGAPNDLAFESITQQIALDVEVVLCLQVQPEPSRHPEVPGQS